MNVHTCTYTNQFNSYFPNKPCEPELTGCLLTGRPHSILEVNPISIGWWLVAWHSDITSVFGRRAFPVLCSTCSWRLSIYMCKLSATGQPTQPFIHLRSVSSNHVCDLTQSGAIWWMLTGWRPGVVDWSGGVLASCYCGSNCPLVRTIDGCICTAVPLPLVNQLPLPRP